MGGDIEPSWEVGGDIEPSWRVGVDIGLTWGVYKLSSWAPSALGGEICEKNVP